MGLRTPRIGELKEVVNIINVTTPYGVDGSGTFSSTFKSNVLAKVEPLGGGKKDEAETQEDQAFAQTYSVWIRYLSGITVFQQLTWGTKRLMQTAPPESFDQDRWLLLHVEECQSRDL